jgi:hypothetical protein
MEDLSKCSEPEIISVLSVPRKLTKPVLRRKKNQWLILKADTGDVFDPGLSTIILLGPGPDSPGVSIDPAKSAFKLAHYIMVPLCIEDTAETGLWTVEIETAEVNDHFLKKIIKCSFEVR